MKRNERYSIASRVLLALEGGYVNHPDDPGGETKHGWTKKALREVNFLEPVSSLSATDAKHLYYIHYWKGDMVSSIESPLLASVMLHLEVATGPGGNRADQATKWLQRSLRLCGWDIFVDGVMGTKTLAAVNNSCGTILAHSVSSQFITHAAWLDARRGSSFLKGWTNRAVNGILWTEELIRQSEGATDE